MAAKETELDPFYDQPADRTVRDLRITVVEGPDAGTSYVTKAQASSIGSHPSNDFVLSDRRVSRFHCEVQISDAGARLIDQGSRNGTFLDGVRVQDAWLREGSVVRLGRDVLSVEPLSSSSRIKASRSSRFGSLIGSSLAMRACFAILERAASMDTTVLLQGETGTGKEAAARSLHDASSRSDGPFVVVDCGSISASLVESELFGHVRGAFTGAERSRIGAFEAADGGTLFLDEIGELPLELQPRLLRVLEERTVQPVGSVERRPIDFRLVAATHRDLRNEVNGGSFRADLYYRLAVIRVTLPSLRERPEDIPLISSGLLDSLGASTDLKSKILTKETITELHRGAWPGNVRQLRNYLELAMLLGSGPPVDGPSVPEHLVVDPRVSYSESRRAALDHFEKLYLVRLLEHYRDNVSAAARGAGMNRMYLYELLRRHGLR